MGGVIAIIVILGIVIIIIICVWKQRLVYCLRDFSWGGGQKRPLAPLQMLLPPELDLNSKLALSQQLHSMVNIGKP